MILLEKHWIQDQLSFLISVVFAHHFPYLIMGGENRLIFINLENDKTDIIRIPEASLFGIGKYKSFRKIAIHPKLPKVIAATNHAIGEWDIKSHKNLIYQEFEDYISYFSVREEDFILFLQDDEDQYWISVNWEPKTRFLPQYSFMDKPTKEEYNCMCMDFAHHTIAMALFDFRISICAYPELRISRILIGHSDSITNLVFQKSNHHLLSGSLDCTMRLWDYVSGECIAIFTHSDAVSIVKFHPFLDYAVSGTIGGKVFLWNLENKSNNPTMLNSFENEITAIEFDQAGSRLAVISKYQTLRVLKITDHLFRNK